MSVCHHCKLFLKLFSWPENCYQIDGIRRRSLTSAQFSEKLASWGWPKFASLKDLRDVAAGNSSVCIEHRQAHQLRHLLLQHHLYISVTLQPIPSDIEAISPAFVPASVELKPRTDELQAVLATMFNDPANSDIEFVFPSGSGRSPSKLYALKSILSMRCAYFKTSPLTRMIACALTNCVCSVRGRRLRRRQIQRRSFFRSDPMRSPLRRQRY